MHISDFSTHDWFDISLGVISLLGTFVGLLASVMAMRISIDANSLSQKAVEISMFTHKKEVAPELQLSWGPVGTGEEATFELVNLALGKALVWAYSSNFRNALKLEIPNKTEFTLLHNGRAIFTLDTGLNPEPKTALTIFDETSLRDKIKPIFTNCWIVVFYKDILGTPFKVLFEHNAVGSIFESRIEELDPQHKGYMQYFQKQDGRKK